ncbi:Protein SDA1-like [Gracilariopsis chorda]|uniref:Protein SDA1 n=1 Tax=Gracilariopsis chorda TaxID=448386 RepID=A0A2V3IE29_9FLOR|nr:Protein SDA1-like [Gracilariopsis chorda]|eukprot:PXF40317.1 Protein SDA1-like [Gracilariopsis chorda]
MDVDLMILQERCRKDPLSYEDDFVSQRRHFDALLSAANLRPSDANPRLAEVASFMGSVAHCYGNEGIAIATDITTFLGEYGQAMNPELRRSLVRLLCLLRARGTADPTTVIPLFFRLLSCNDKVLRRMLHGHIVSDVKKIQNSGDSSRKVLQTFLFSMVQDPSETLVKRSLHVLVDLFRKRIWNDPKCANMIATACFHEAMPVAIIASRFILNSESKENTEDWDDESDEEGLSTARKTIDGQKASDMWKAYNMTGKKSTRKKKKMERVINRLTRVKSSAHSRAISESNPGHPSLEAMMLINDPQEFTERLFKDLQTRRKRESYENRLIFVNLISRLVGTHELILFSFYPFLQRYLQPAQPEVTRVLAYLTQACHDKVPSDVLHPILRGLADTFVSERSSPPSVAAGINTIRAICSRVPLAILDEENECKAEREQESALLEDLVQYKTSKDKGIMMAARSLISLYREVHPGLLQKKDRGRAGAEAVQKGRESHAKAYGTHLYAIGVEGIELLNEADSEGDQDEMDSDADSKPQPESAENDEQVEDLHKDDDVVDGGAESEEERSCEVDERKEDTQEDDEKGEKESGNRLDAMQILSNEDFERIRLRRAAKAIGESARVLNAGEAVNPDDLQGPVRRERRTLEERMESVLKGREGREKFGKRAEKGGGSTNKQKLKKKSNAMVIHKRRRKNKQLSRRDKQLAKRRKRDYR